MGMKKFDNELHKLYR
ncbi:hypothetical protein BN1723_016604 [Verticillium longisporum]|uniref:Uncharacterized protein n=1 Tax=Verticillium longisporum TaxID=100787 RepID=A0A0G4NHD5_VERLO|nr:hypothetical protein BN1723_016604 [Verticillium longisporum]